MPREFTLPHDYADRPYQVPASRYLDNGGLRAVLVWHRRAGKDLVAAHRCVRAMFERKGAYWHVFPTAEQGRKAMWQGFTRDGRRIMEQVFPGEVRRKPKDGFEPNASMVVETVNGSLYSIVGSDNVELVGAPPVGVIFSEYSLAKPKSWDLVRPILAENGGWAVFCYTPRGNNHGKQLFDFANSGEGKRSGWFAQLLTLQDTKAYDPDATLLEARASGMPEPLIRQEYLCDWTAALVGSVWGDLLEALEKKGAVSDFPHASDAVFTNWDLGISDATAIWWWRLARHGDELGVDLLDYYENHGKPLSHYADVVAGKGYKYAKHWLPHDARARTLATGSSVLDQCLQLFGNDKVAIGPDLSLLDGIQAARWLLQQRVRIHSRCGEGLEALKQYHYKWDDERKTFSQKPEHDWSSHGADGLRYAACVVRVSELLTRPVDRKSRANTGVRVLPDGTLEGMTLDDMWKLKERRR